MLYEFSDELYLQLNEELAFVEKSEREPSKIISASLNKIRVALQTLKEYVEKHSFANNEEEIQFFKHIKPKFYKQQIYLIKRYKIDTIKPCGTAETLQKFYEEELIAISRFFNQNQFLYQYYRNGMTELDSQYFIRGTQLQTELFADIPEVQPEFSTNADYLFSRFIAYEMLCNELISRINQLKNPVLASLEQPSKRKQNLTWTGDKVNIAELAYGLYYTGQFNGGNCDVADIIAWLEDSLNMQMGSVHRKFIDIRRRKTISYTKFLDQMRDAIQKRVEEDLVYKPNRGIQLRNPSSELN